MRERRLGVTAAVEHRHLPVLVQAFETCHVRVEAKVIVDLAQFVLADPEFGPVPVVGVVTVRNEFTNVFSSGTVTVSPARRSMFCGVCAAKR